MRTELIEKIGLVFLLVPIAAAIGFLLKGFYDAALMCNSTTEFWVALILVVMFGVGHGILFSPIKPYQNFPQRKDDE